MSLVAPLFERRITQEWSLYKKRKDRRDQQLKVTKEEGFQGTARKKGKKARHHTISNRERESELGLTLVHYTTPQQKQQNLPSSSLRSTVVSGFLHHLFAIALQGSGLFFFFFSLLSLQTVNCYCVPKERKGYVLRIVALPLRPRRRTNISFASLVFYVERALWYNSRTAKRIQDPYVGGQAGREQLIEHLKYEETNTGQNTRLIESETKQRSV